MSGATAVASVHAAAMPPPVPVVVEAPPTPNVPPALEAVPPAPVLATEPPLPVAVAPDVVVPDPVVPIPLDGVPLDVPVVPPEPVVELDEPERPGTFVVVSALHATTNPTQPATDQAKAAN
ncbi:MAG TPA: hypothetical protein VF989_02540 [Polyangiaceae bacterium]